MTNHCSWVTTLVWEQLLAVKPSNHFYQCLWGCTYLQGISTVCRKLIICHTGNIHAVCVVADTTYELAHIRYECTGLHSYTFLYLSCRLLQAGAAALRDVMHNEPSTG